MNQNSMEIISKSSPFYIRSVLRICSALAAASVCALADAAPPAKLNDAGITLHEAGQMPTFVVAGDEVGRFDAAGHGRVEKVPPHRGAEAVRQWAREHGVTGRDDLVLYESGVPRSAATRRWLTARVLARLAPGVDASAIAARVGAAGFEQPGYAPGCVIFSAPAGAGNALALCEALRKQAGIESAEPLLAKMRTKRYTPNDPFYAYNSANAGYQWALRNTGQNAGTAGIDINVTTAWDTVRGAGLRIGIIDDGLQATHPDLAANVDTANGYDWNDRDSDPSPGANDNHGTACAGVAAARGNNGAGLSGAAPEATLIGLRLIAGPVTDADEAAAFSWRNDLIQVKNNAWGPDDYGGTIQGPGVLAEAALGDGVVNGRGGLGTLYFWAGGDGLAYQDNSNFDGYANSIYSIAVGAVGDNGVQTDESEPGANLLVCAPSSSTGRQGITTTDVAGIPGYTNGTLPGDYPSADYTNAFGGTSSACSLASGVGALLLQSNPTLGWRDVKEILLRSATKNDSGDAGWANNSAGFHFSHKYGAGLINAQAAITLATGWTKLGPMTYQRSAQTSLALAIPNGSATGVTRSFVFAAAQNLRVEEVTVEVDITHTSRGDLAVTLTSPSGMVSRLATQRTNDATANLKWKFSSTRHWGEQATGTWTVKVTDPISNANSGTLNAVTLTLYGAAAATTSAPAITSATTAGTNVGSPFSYQILASNAPTSFTAAGVPTGLTLNTATGAISGTPTFAGTFSVTLGATNANGTGSATLTLTIGASLGVPVGDAVDQPALTWATDAAHPWLLQSAIAHDGVDAARSAAIGNDQQSSFSVTITGPTLMRFWWKVSSELNADILSITSNGSELAEISGEVNWQQQSFYFAAGIYRLEWTYAKDSGTVAGSDAAWVDQISFAAAEQSAPIVIRQPQPLTVAVGGLAFMTVQAVGAPPLSYQWRKGGVPISGATGLGLAIAAAASGDAGSYDCMVSDALGSTTSGAATLTVLTASGTLATALDNTTLKWATYADSNLIWTSQTTTTHDGVDAARSGVITDSQSTSFSTTVTGPGTLTFWWKSGSEQGLDFLNFVIDGTNYNYLTGTVDWRQETVAIPAGAHVLQWSYQKNDSSAVSPDAGYVDQVVFTAGAYNAWATANFTLAQLVDASISGPSVDPNRDGVTNLAAYAFAISPTQGGGAPRPQLTFDGTNYALQYQKNTAATDVTFTVQRSTDLATWTAVSVTNQIVSTNGTLQTIRAVLPAPNGATNFYRLLLTLP